MSVDVSANERTIPTRSNAKPPATAAHARSSIARARNSPPASARASTWRASSWMCGLLATYTRQRLCDSRRHHHSRLEEPQGASDVVERRIRAVTGSNRRPSACKAESEPKQRFRPHHGKDATTRAYPTAATPTKSPRLRPRLRAARTGIRSRIRTHARPRRRVPGTAARTCTRPPPGCLALGPRRRDSRTGHRSKASRRGVTFARASVAANRLLPPTSTR